MIVDTSRVSLGSRLEDGALTVVEQIPGLVESSDQTQTLRRGQTHNLTSQYLFSLCRIHDSSLKEVMT